MVHLVTGVAGFIGSQLAEALVAAGHRVRGVDCFTDYYDRSAKEANLTGLLGSEAFAFAEADLRTADVASLLDGVDVVYHLAAQPGVRLSWSAAFATYDSCNVLATQRVLEACRSGDVDRVVYASSSSVYGEAGRYPVLETDLPAPHSPYGVTKLAGEHLCNLYSANHGLPVVSLRYFSVYGPRQRPDMAFHRLIESALGGPRFPMFGDGSARRDFTFVGDVVDATCRAGAADLAPGTVLNVCGGGDTALAEVIDAVATLVGTAPAVEANPAKPGDVRRTGGDPSRAAEVLDWRSTTSLIDGLAAQVAWHRSRPDRARTLGDAEGAQASS